MIFEKNRSRIRVRCLAVQMGDVVIHVPCSEAVQVLRDKRQLFERKRMYIVSVCFSLFYSCSLSDLETH